MRTDDMPTVIHSPFLGKELRKIQFITFVTSVILISMGIYIGWILRLSWIHRLFLAFILATFVVVPLTILLVQRQRKRTPQEERDELKKILDRGKRRMLFYSIPSQTLMFFGIVIFVYALYLGDVGTVNKILPITSLLIGIGAIIMGLNFRFNVEYYNALFHTTQGDKANSVRERNSKNLIFTGILLVIMSILTLFLILMYF